MKTVLIIGAGVAGLSTGCYAQQAGLKSTVLEMHTLPGGLCTAWKRKGYVFDYCIHWLVGSSARSAFRDLWDFLDLAPADRMVNHEIFQTRTLSDGTAVHWYTDAHQLVAHLAGFTDSTADRRRLVTLERWIRGMSTFDLTEPDFTGKGLVRLLKSLPAVLTMGAVGERKWADFAAGFQSARLREVLGAFFDMEGFPIRAVIFTLGFLHARNAGYPLGGSLPMAERLEARYRALGGEVRYRRQVAKILVEGNRAVGVRCVDGTEYRADAVVSCADVHATVYDMLENQFPSPEWDVAFRELKPMPGPVMASFGVRLDEVPGPERALLGLRLDNAAPTLDWPLKTPLVLENKTINRVGFHHYAYDPSMGPSHGTPVTFLFNGNTAWWQNLALDPAAYRAEKERFLDDLTAAVDALLPGFASRIEVRDLATPVTNIRYTGNWEGSQESFLMGKNLPLPNTLPGLAGFHLAGQWRHPGGGIPPAAMEGRTVVRALLAEDSFKS